MFSVQCLLLGLHGYLIRFAPLAFIPYCQNCPRKMPSLIVSPFEINTFDRYFERTSYVFQSLAPQSPLHALCLRHKISQGTYEASYGCFRPNKNGCDLDREYYRGGWHSSYPVLIRETIYISQKHSNWNALWLKLSRLRAL